ncbi:unnamed protein product [Linum trigynum]|uniref:Myb-like domain-containing protein n=1 Tax=Linum trigynum TaxID=586398 RepID=A0AAV2G6V6_9ROSI
MDPPRTPKVGVFASASASAADAPPPPDGSQSGPPDTVPSSLPAIAHLKPPGTSISSVTIPPPAHSPVPPCPRRRDSSIVAGVASSEPARTGLTTVSNVHHSADISGNPSGASSKIQDEKPKQSNPLREKASDAGRLALQESLPAAKATAKGDGAKVGPVPMHGFVVAANTEAVEVPKHHFHRQINDIAIHAKKDTDSQLKKGKDKDVPQSNMQYDDKSGVEKAHIAVPICKGTTTDKAGNSHTESKTLAPQTARLITLYERYVKQPCVVDYVNRVMDERIFSLMLLIAKARIERMSNSLSTQAVSRDLESRFLRENVASFETHINGLKTELQDLKKKIIEKLPAVNADPAVDPSLAIENNIVEVSTDTARKSTRTSTQTALPVENFALWMRRWYDDLKKRVQGGILSYEKSVRSETNQSFVTFIFREKELLTDNRAKILDVWETQVSAQKTELEAWERKLIQECATFSSPPPVDTGQQTFGDEAVARRNRTPFTLEEMKELVDGYEEHGPKWTKIRDTRKFKPIRTPGDLADKFKNMVDSAKLNAKDRRGEEVVPQELLDRVKDLHVLKSKKHKRGTQ